MDSWAIWPGGGHGIQIKPWGGWSWPWTEPWPYGHSTSGTIPVTSVGGWKDIDHDLPDSVDLVNEIRRGTRTAEPEFDPPLDAGIARYVEVLYANGIETYESCEGGPGHAYPEPTIRFHGDQSEGFRALAIALQHGLPVQALRRAWEIIDGVPVGPHWEMTFYTSARAE